MRKFFYGSTFYVSMAVILLTVTAWTQAHEGHAHLPVTMKKAVDIALETVRNASQEAQSELDLQRLDASWRALPIEAARIYENGRGYYVVSVENAAQSETLYVRILLDGHVDAANFSGEFTKPAQLP